MTLLPFLRFPLGGLAVCLGGATAPAVPTLRGPVDEAHARAIGFVEHVHGLAANPAAVLVRYRPGTGEEERASLRALVGDGTHERVELVEDLEIVYTRVRARYAVQRLAPLVEWVELDPVVHASTVPNDPGFGSLWGLHSTGQTIGGVPTALDADIDAPEAWSVTTGDPDFVVAVIDSGVEYTHPDLAANIWSNPGEIAGNGIDDDLNGRVDDVRGWDFYDRDRDPWDEGGHGTHVSGTIGAVGDNGVGVAGVNWRCKLLPLRFLGPGGGYTSDAVLALQYAVQKGVRVSNNSWGGGTYSASLSAAIQAAQGAGHLFVAAAGNDGRDTDAAPQYPSSYDFDNVISVGAIDNTNGRPSWTNYGRRSVDLVAPGQSIYSTYLGGTYTMLSGTSMACPHVTGVVALVWGLYPSWTWRQVRGRIFSTVRPVASFATRSVTGGAVDAAAAVGAGPAEDHAPVVFVQEPYTGTQVLLGTTLLLRGTADDVQDGDLTPKLGWSSSLAGELGTGGQVSTSALALGTHVITASVTDAAGNVRSVAVSVTVVATLSPPIAPSVINATAIGGGNVWLAWPDASNNESGFQVDRQQLVGSTFTNTLRIPVGANVMTLQDAPGAGTFRYAVRAVNSAGNSAWTNWYTVTVN